MVCACANSINSLIPRLAPLSANLPAGLNLQSAAALGAAAQTATNASANLSANLALAAQLGLNVNAAALGSLSALAQFCAAMSSAFGINMSSPGAGASLGQLFDSLVRNGFNQMLAGLPLDAIPRLDALSSLANCAGLGVNPSLPNASAALNALAANHLNLAAQLAANANSALGAAGNLSAAAAAQLSNQLSAMASAQALARTGLGVNLAGAGPGALGSGLAPALSTIASNIAALVSQLQRIPAALLEQAARLMAALANVNGSLKLDLTTPGMGAQFSQALSRAAAANAAASGFGAGAAMAAGTSAASLSAQQAVFQSAQFNSLAIPQVPPLGALLAAFANHLLSALGVRLAQHSPCGPACLSMPPLLPGCLCPTVAAQLAALPPPKPPEPQLAVKANLNPSVSVAAAPPNPVLGGVAGLPPSARVSAGVNAAPSGTLPGVDPDPKSP